MFIHVSVVSPVVSPAITSPLRPSSSHAYSHINFRSIYKPLLPWSPICHVVAEGQFQCHIFIYVYPGPPSSPHQLHTYHNQNQWLCTRSSYWPIWIVTAQTMSYMVFTYLNCTNWRLKRNNNLTMNWKSYNLLSTCTFTSNIIPTTYSVTK